MTDPNANPPFVSFTFRELFEKIDTKLDLINTVLAGRLGSVEQRISTVEGKLPQIAVLSGQLPKMDERLTSLERADAADTGGQRFRDAYRADLFKLGALLTAVVSAAVGIIAYVN